MRSDSVRRAVLAGTGLLVLLVVVALATRGNLGGSHGGPGPGQGFVDYAFTAFLAVFLLMIPLAAYLYWQQRAELVYETSTRRRRSFANLLTLASLLVLAGWIEYLRTHHRGPFATHLRPPQAHIPGSKRFGRDGGAEPAFHWWLFVLTIAVFLGGAAAVFLAARRGRRRGAREAESAGEAVSLALDEALDDLREGDARRAVIAAYARLELILRHHGLAREPHEAPFEWLSRILVGLRASAASAERLAGLFERARFSRHTIDETMREDAIGALSSVRDELRAAA